MDIATKQRTMTSTQFAEMTGRELKSINRTIREMFSAEIEGAIIAPTLRENGQVAEYHLPETESIMLAAKLDKSYLRKISEFWKNRNEPGKPKSFEELVKETLALADVRIKALESKIEADRPAVTFSNAVQGSDNAILVRAFAKILANSGVITGQNRLYQWFRDNAYLNRNNEPYQAYIERGLFEVVERVLGDGKQTFTVRTTKVTGKGQIYFANKLTTENCKNEQI